MKLSDVDRACLKQMDDPAIYCTEILDREQGKRLCDAGFIEWVPPPSWHGENSFRITDVGREALKEK